MFILLGHCVCVCVAWWLCVAWSQCCILAADSTQRVERKRERERHYCYTQVHNICVHYDASSLKKYTPMYVCECNCIPYIHVRTVTLSVYMQ